MIPRIESSVRWNLPLLLSIEISHRNSTIFKNPGLRRQFTLCFPAAALAVQCLAPLAALGRVCGVPKGGSAGARASRSIPASPAGGRWWGAARSGASLPRRPAGREASQNQGSVRLTAPPLRARHPRPRAAPECSTVASPRHGSPRRPIPLPGLNGRCHYRKRSAVLLINDRLRGLLSQLLSRRPESP